MTPEPEQGISSYRMKVLRDPDYPRKHREGNRKWYRNHREEKREYNKKYQNNIWTKEALRKKREEYILIKKEIMILLGNKCVRCGFSDTRILQIDHVNGNGTKEIHSFKSRWSNDYYKFVLEQIKQGSKKYQLLCPNCNWIKRIELHEYKEVKKYD